jgi:FKBP-type peptidyl-prolyl cis-trans isomerase 2
MSELARRALALAAFLAILAGGVYAAEQAFGSGAPHAGAPGVSLTSLTPALAAAPGADVTFALVARNTGAVDLQVNFHASDGPRARFTPTGVALGPGEAAGVWVTFDVPAASGPLRALVAADAHVRPPQGLVEGCAQRRCDLEVVNRTTTLLLTITLLPAQGGARDGDTLQVDFVERLQNGTVLATSVKDIAEGPFPKSGVFRTQRFTPVSVPLGPPGPNSPPAPLLAGLHGMVQGESKTVRLEPWEAFGNATREERLPRTQELARLSQAFERVQQYPRNLLSPHLNESSRVGDVVHVKDNSGNERAYRVEALDEGNVTLRWLVAPGDAFTVYPLFPDQSRAVEVTDATVRFRTDPADPNATLTAIPQWPNMTRIASVNDTAILLRHDPPVGLEVRGPQGGVSRVVEVTGTAVVIEVTNDNPFAGEPVLFDVTVRGVTRAT